LLNLAPALNLATFLAAIFMAFPVWGFLPFQAFRFATEKLPNPGTISRSPFFKALAIPSKTPFTALPAAAFVTFASFATFATNSSFVMPLPSLLFKLLTENVYMP
jgi:hypothetical protein